MAASASIEARESVLQQQMMPQPGSEPVRWGGDYSSSWMIRQDEEMYRK